MAATGEIAQTMAGKVARVTVAFWIIKIIATTLGETGGDALSMPPIELGTMKLHHARVTFADMYLFDHLKLNRQPTLMIGMDVLGSFDVLIIDYKLREMQIRTRNSVQPR